MKLVIQRVKKAKVVRVSDGEITGQIGLGLFVLVGFKKGDCVKDVETFTSKLSKLRIMGDEHDKMNLSIQDVGGSVLVVSQFTLYADINGGNRPSFVNAEEPAKAKALYEQFISSLREKHINVETGSFGDYMQIDAEIDGPVTIIYDD